MKTCPICKQTYTDDDQNFCLNDGGILVKVNDDPPPTVFMNQARTTNQNWSDAATNSPWNNQQNRQMANNQPLGVQGQNQAFAVQGQNQTLPTISLILGILGILLICCWGGVPFGAGALVTGYLALGNVNREPMNYGGRGVAIGGMITGAIALATGLFWIFIMALSK